MFFAVDDGLHQSEPVPRNAVSFIVLCSSHQLAGPWNLPSFIIQRSSLVQNVLIIK